MEKRKDVIIKKADKGSAICILNANDYEQMVLKHLNDEKFYIATQNNLTSKHTDLINQHLSQMLQKNEVH